jgi:uncharacterized repeat protein (TIGR03803 family)
MVRWVPKLRKLFGCVALVLLVGAFALTIPARAQTGSTIYSFTLHDSFWPEGGLAEDASGNLYGTTVGGGTYGTGTVYQLSPPAKGSTTWIKTVLYNFQPWGITGHTPSSELAIDSSGDLYGVTWSGGDGRCHCGVLYELVPPATAGGAWKHFVLHAFTNTGNDGRLPNAPVMLFSNTTAASPTSSSRVRMAALIPSSIPLAPTTMPAGPTARCCWIQPAACTALPL